MDDSRSGEMPLPGLDYKNMISIFGVYLLSCAEGARCHAVRWPMQRFIQHRMEGDLFPITSNELRLSKPTAYRAKRDFILLTTMHVNLK